MNRTICSASSYLLLIGAQFLEKHRHVVHSKRVLEVGSGTGVSGLAAAYLGASLSVLTDLAYTLENLQANIALNYCAADTNSNSIDNKPIVHALDWTDVTTYVSPADFNQLDTLSRPDNVDGGADNSWDVILGADVVWLEELVEPLVTALRSLCSPQTIVLLSHQVSFKCVLSQKCCSALQWCKDLTFCFTIVICNLILSVHANVMATLLKYLYDAYDNRSEVSTRTRLCLVI